MNLKCLSCGKPLCKENCPISTKINEITKLVKEDRFDEALTILYQNNPIPYITGLLCEGYCTINCILNKNDIVFSYKDLELELSKFVFDTTIFYKPLNGKKIGIIGGGISGIASAILFRREGFRVDIYEKGHILNTLFDTFSFDKLSMDEYDYIVDRLNREDIHFIISEIGKDLTINELRNYYDYVVIASGYDVSKKIDIEGDKSYKYCFDEISYYKNLELKEDDNDLFNQTFYLYGLGNVSLDLALILKRLSANVNLIYYKPRERSRLSIHDQKRIEGNELNVLFDTRVISYKDGEITIEHNNELSKLNGKLIVAVGQKSSYNFLNNSSIKIEDLVIDEEYKTKIDNLFIIGDLVEPVKDISNAIKSAKNILKNIVD